MADAVRCWIVTEALAGLQNQAKGLAEALGFSYSVTTLSQPPFPWHYLPSRLWPGSMALKLGREGPKLEPPWPDVLITCGRVSVAASIAIRKASGGATFTAHVQDPRVNPLLFDCVIVAEHDACRGENVLVTPGALHRVTPDKLEEGRMRFQSLFGPMKKPLFAVLAGGSTKRSKVGPGVFGDFAGKLANIASTARGSVALTPSRRTGAENEATLRAGLKDVPAWIWDGQGENPYFGLLSHADAIVVTGDSVSMTSEACSTGKPVYVYDLGTESKRVRAFQENMVRIGATRPFSGVAESWTPTRLNDVEAAAAFVRHRLKDFVKERMARPRG